MGEPLPVDMPEEGMPEEQEKAEEATAVAVAVVAVPAVEKEATAGTEEDEEASKKAAARAGQDEEERNFFTNEQQNDDQEEDEDDDDEVGECGFCLFMKSGPCRDSFVKWEECVEQAEKGKEDMVEKCHQITFMLKECMEHNPDYYEPVLQAEKAMGEAAALEEEAAAAQGGNDSTIDSPSAEQGSSDARTPSEPADSHVSSEVPEHHQHE